MNNPIEIKSHSTDFNNIVGEGKVDFTKPVFKAEASFEEEKFTCKSNCANTLKEFLSDEQSNGLVVVSEVSPENV